VVGYQITDGQHDGVSLNGLTLGYVAKWPGPIHRGEGRALVFIDETASAEQRKALEAIGAGRAGPGGPFEIFASTMKEPAEIAVGPADFQLNGKRGLLKFGSVAEVTVGPIIGDMTQEEANCRMLLPEGFIWRDALLVNTGTGTAKTSRFSFSLQNSNAFFSEVAYNT
jgi:hypothetical protein